MKIFIPSQSKQTLGGGFTFRNNFIKYSKKQGVEMTPIETSDILFISGATMLQRDFVQKAKDDDLKIVLRVDNIPRNSRNRNTGTSRLYDFSQIADLVIYQSQWAKDYIMPFIKKDGPVILNGADTEIFNSEGSSQPKEMENQYLFVQYNRDETKEFHRAWYWYQMLQREDPGAHLWIVGNFSNEHIEYNFDFFMGERFEYKGILDNPKDMAEYYRGADRLIYSYFNDACSNTLIEALNCGCNPYNPEELKGSSKEILDAFKEDKNILSADYMVKRYLEEIEKIL